MFLHVAGRASDLSKLRKVLDFAPAAASAKWGDRRYFEALVRRMNREVLVERTLVTPARDEAVEVVSPEEWAAAQSARERQLLQEAELERTKEELAAVQAREAELQREVDELRARLSGLRVEQERRRAALQLVAVRRAAAPAAPEAPPPDQWLPAPEEEPQAREGAPAARREVVPAFEEEDRLAAEADAAEQAIARVEAEIRKIEDELASLADQERGLRTRGTSAPYTHRGYTLYKRSAGAGEGRRDLYFFAKKVPDSGEPSPLPPGYSVASNARTGLPYLKRTGGKKARGRRRA